MNEVEQGLATDEIVTSPPEHLRYGEARKLAMAEFEKRYVIDLLQRNDGNVSLSAREAGMDRVYLHRLIRRYELKGSGHK